MGKKTANITTLYIPVKCIMQQHVNGNIKLVRIRRGGGGALLVTKPAQPSRLPSFKRASAAL